MSLGNSNSFPILKTLESFGKPKNDDNLNVGCRYGDPHGTGRPLNN
nr:MAG TPA: hypothetical protein [Caudoviricetes sp.]